MNSNNENNISLNNDIVDDASSSPSTPNSVTSPDAFLENESEIRIHDREQLPSNDVFQGKVSRLTSIEQSNLSPASQSNASDTVSPLSDMADLSILKRKVHRQALLGPPLSVKFNQWMGPSQQSFNSPLASYSIASLFTEHIKLIPKIRKCLQSHLFFPLYVHITSHSLCLFDIETLQMIQNLTLPLKVFIGVRFVRPIGLLAEARKQFLHLCTIEESLAKKVMSTSFTIWDARSGRILAHQKLQHIKGKNLFDIYTWEDNYIVFVSVRGEMEMWRLNQAKTEDKQNAWCLEFCWYWNFSKEVNPVASVCFSPFKKHQLAITTPSHVFFVNDFNDKRAPQTLENWFKVSQTKIQDMVWSPNQESQLYLITSREISIYDMDLRKNILGKSIRCPNSRSDFQSMHLDDGIEQVFFTTHADGTIGAWHWDSAKNMYMPSICDVIRGSKHGIERSAAMVSVAFSPKTKDVIAYDCDGTRWIWKFDISREKVKWILRGYFESISSQISSLQVSPYSLTVAVGTNAGDLYIYNLEDGLLTYKYKVFDGAIQNITWSSENSLICSSNSTGNKNGLVSISLYTGEVLQLKSGSDVSSDPIIALRISQSKKFLLVIQKTKAVELWNLHDFQVVCFIPFPVSTVKTLNWCHPTDTIYDRLSDKSSEIFYISFSTSQQGNSLIYYLINDSTKEVSKLKEVQYPITSHLVEKNRIRISGDSNGNILIWNRGKKTEPIPVQYSAHRGAISKICFSYQGPYAFILYLDGFIEVWDLDSRNILSKASLRHQITDCDWTHNNLLVCARVDGSVLVYDMLLKKSFDSITKRTILEPLMNPLMLNDRESLALRLLLEEDKLNLSSVQIPQGLVFRNGYGEMKPVENPYDLVEKNEHEEWMKIVQGHRALIPKNVITSIENAPTQKEKFLTIAQYFSEDAIVKFWELASVNLKQLKSEEIVERLKSQVDILSANSDMDDYTETPKVTYEKSLPSSLGVYRDKQSIQCDEQRRLFDHDYTVKHLRNGEGTDLYQQVAQEQALFGNKDDAVNLLLQTPHDHEDVFVNYFHACVCAASNSPSHFRQTVLYVTSSLIAKRNHPGNVNDRKKDLAYATELLCLIGETHRACRILQNSDMWERAAQIAQTLCKDEERYDILIRWANHLSRNNDKLRACFVWLNLGYLYNVLVLLLGMKMDSVAISLLKVIEEEHLPIIRCNRKGIGILSEKILENEIKDEVQPPEDILLQQLKCRIYWTYARTLRTCHLFDLAKQYESLIDPESIQLSKSSLYLD